MHAWAVILAAIDEGGACLLLCWLHVGVRDATDTPYSHPLRMAWVVGV